MTQLLLLPGQSNRPCDTTPEATTVQHALAAAHKVVLGEIAWFRTLDDDTVERIAEAAPDHAVHEHAAAELRRRRSASWRSRRSSAQIAPAPGA
jgi:hypothetical protein